MLLFPGQPPSQLGRYSVSMSGDLSISDIHSEDSGYYICQAISVAGSVVAKALLEVKTGECLGLASQVKIVKKTPRINQLSVNTHFSFLND